MQPVCFVLQVKPERLQEFKDYHRTVWPEMRTARRERGQREMTHFFVQSENVLPDRAMRPLEKVFRGKA